MARFRNKLAHCGYCVPGKDRLGNAEAWDSENKKPANDDTSHRKGDGAIKKADARKPEWFTMELRVDLAGVNDPLASRIRDFWVAKLNEVVDFADKNGAHAEWSPVG